MNQFAYHDILNLPYPNEEIERDFPEKVLHAAQFAPFSALTGHDKQVEETARFTEEEILLDETEKLLLDKKFRYLKENLMKNPTITVTYFIPDKNKSGGSYQKKTGNLIKISAQEQMLVFSDDTKIPLQHIISVDSDLFYENIIESIL